MLRRVAFRLPLIAFLVLSLLGVWSGSAVAAATTWSSSGVPQLGTAQVAPAGTSAPCPHAISTTDTCVYAIGGANGGSILNTVQVYDPNQVPGTWTTVGVPQLGTGRQGLAATAAPCPPAISTTHTCLYAMGGATLVGGSGKVEVYDPQALNGAWTTSGVPQFPGALTYLAAVTARCPAPSTDTCVYAMGGTGADIESTTVEIYDPQQPNAGWTGSGVPQLAVGTTQLAATTGPCLSPSTDTCIYAIGGRINGSESSIVQMYDPSDASGTWTTSGVPQLGTARHFFAASTGLCPSSTDTCLFAIGGLNGASYLVTVEALDPRQPNAAWTTTSVPQLGVGREGLAAAAAACPGGADTCLYALGGANPFAVTTVETYDPQQAGWTTFGVPQLHPSQHQLPTAAVSGPCPAPNTDACLYSLRGPTTVEAYDPTQAGSAWTTIGVPQLGVNQSAQAVTAGPCPGSSDTCLYSIGGAGLISYESTVQAYDPEQPDGTWTTIGVPQLGQARQYLAALTAPCPVPSSDTCLYAIGGSHPPDTNLSTVEVYDPEQANGAWTTVGVPQLGIGRDLLDAVTAACPAPSTDTCLYAIGGSAVNGVVTASTTVEIYDPKQVGGSWTTAGVPQLATAITSAAATLAPCTSSGDTCIYVVGGEVDTFPYRTNEVQTYDPKQAGGAWTAAGVPQLQVARFELGAATGPCPAPIQGTCPYAIGGNNVTTVEYLPPTLTGAGVPAGITATEASVTPSTVIGSFHDTDMHPCADYQVTITSFGDSADSSENGETATCQGVLSGHPSWKNDISVACAAGICTISTTRLYHEEQSTAIQFTVTDTTDGDSIQRSTPVSVADAPLTASGVGGGKVCAAGSSCSLTLGTFTDGNTLCAGEGAVGSLYTVTVSDNGNPVGAGTYQQLPGSCSFRVSYTANSLSTGNHSFTYCVQEAEEDSSQTCSPAGSAAVILVPNLKIVRSGTTGDSFGITLTPDVFSPCTGSFTGSGVPAGGSVPTETITGNYYGNTVFFLVRYAGSTAYYYGTITKTPLGQIYGSGKDSGGVARTYLATSSALWQANQTGCQDVGIVGMAPIAGTAINAVTTRTFGAISDNDGFSSVSPDVTVTVSFGDGSQASCAGSACFSSSVLPDHVRLINCVAGAVPALPGSAVFPGVRPDVGCQVQATHIYKTASGANGYSVTIGVTDKDQTIQPAPVVDTIQVGGG